MNTYQVQWWNAPWSDHTIEYAMRMFQEHGFLCLTEDEQRIVEWVLEKEGV